MRKSPLYGGFSQEGGLRNRHQGRQAVLPMPLLYGTVPLTKRRFRQRSSYHLERPLPRAGYGRWRAREGVYCLHRCLLPRSASAPLAPPLKLGRGARVLVADRPPAAAGVWPSYPGEAGRVGVLSGPVASVRLELDWFLIAARLPALRRSSSRQG